MDPARRLDLRLVAPACAAWAALAWQLDHSAVWLTCLAACALVAALLVLRLPGRGIWALGLAATAIVLTAGAAQSAIDRAGPVTSLAADRAVAQVTGTVLTEPRLLVRGDEHRDLVVFSARIEHVIARGEASEVDTPVVVFADPSWAGIPWRARFEARGRLGPTTPGQQAVAAFSPTGPPTVLDRPGLVLRTADLARERLRLSVADLPDDARGLIPGLVIGDTSLTTADLTDAMRATGMTHLSAVSGSNVAIVLGTVLVLCGWVGVGRRWRPWIAVGCLVGFVILCRPEPSVLRAGVMGLIGLAALGASRRQLSLPALGATLLLLLTIDPWLARSAGFALSALATLGLIIFARPWGEAMARVLPDRCRLLAYAAAIPLAAQVVCAPVIVLLQGSVSTVSVLTNLLAAPLVAPTTVAGIGATLAGTIWLPAGQALAWVGALPAWLIGRIARWGAQLPGSSIDWPDGAVGAWLLAALTLAGLLTGPFLLEQVASRRRLWLPVATATMLGILAWAMPVPGASTWPPAGWQIVGCDVGQGDAFLVSSGPGHAVVIDVGPEPALVSSCLRSLEIRQVDALVLTHFHADHVNGLDGVLGEVPVAAAYVTPEESPPVPAAQTLKALAEAQVPTYVVHAGDHLTWGPVSADVVWPARRVATGSVPNNNSVVLDLTVGRTRTLFAGDIELDAAVSVRRAMNGQDVDVLKVAHHGSALQDRALVLGIHPEVAMIGVGADNTFGHPAPSALRLLGQTGAVVLRTDTDGDIAMLKTDTGQLLVVRRNG